MSTRVPSATSPRQHRVALLDDDPDVAFGLRDYFGLCGYDAEAFVSVTHLRAAMRRQPFDAFILDWALDGDTSEELIRQILEAPTAAPVLVLSGNVGVGDQGARRLSELELHGVRIYEKPVRPSHLKAVVDRVLCGRTASA